jgi:peptidoglycan/LPS O-acetylase OafA/YrhL
VAATLAVSGLLAALSLRLWPDIAALHGGIHHTVRFTACFWLGMAAWRFRDLLPVDWRIAGALTLAATACLGTPLADALIYLAEVYGALVIALIELPVVAGQLEIDISYGLYLFGYPVEQMLVRYLPDLSAPVVATVALLVTAVIAFASWRYIEHPAIRAKTEAAARITRALRLPRRSAL